MTIDIFMSVDRRKNKMLPAACQRSAARTPDTHHIFVIYIDLFFFFV